MAEDSFGELGTHFYAVLNKDGLDNYSFERSLVEKIKIKIWVICAVLFDRLSTASVLNNSATQQPQPPPQQRIPLTSH